MTTKNFRFAQNESDVKNFVSSETKIVDKILVWTFCLKFFQKQFSFATNDKDFVISLLVKTILFEKFFSLIKIWVNFSFC